MQTKGYSGYRGRGRNKKTGLVIVLSVILVLACLFLAFQQFIVYDANGGAKFVWPGSEKKTEETAQEKVDVEVTKGKKKTIATPRPSDKVAPTELRGLTLVSDFFFYTAATEPFSLGEENSGFNTVMLCLKEQSGRLHYQTTTQSAIDAGAVEATEFAAGNIHALVTSPYYTVVQLYALHDSVFAYANMQQAALLRSDAPDSIWYDAQSSFWLNPEKELTVRYLTSLSAEVASLGVDEIMLDDFCYPPADSGEVDKIDKSGRKMSEHTALAQLAGDIRSAIEPYGAKLSVRLRADDVLGGGNGASGIVFAELAEIFDRIYVETTADQVPALRAAFEGYGADFVPILREGNVSGNCVYGIA